MEIEGRWRDLDRLLNRNGMITGPGFEPAPELREFLAEDCRVLCVGAGGLGCEVLKVRGGRPTSKPSDQAPAAGLVSVQRLNSLWRVPWDHAGSTGLGSQAHRQRPHTARRPARS